MKGCDKMAEPPATPAPSRRYHGQISHALALLENIVIDGLQHGFFGCSIECEIVNDRKRMLVIRAGKSHKFYIHEDELPR
jgi:hypothetical protein